MARKSNASPINVEPTIRIYPGTKTERTVARCQQVRKDGSQCKKPSMNGLPKCRKHGGANMLRIGPANPNWKGGVSTTVHRMPGRWTTMLAPSHQASYIRSLEDPELLSLVGEIGLVDVRLEEAVSRTKTFADWSAVKDAYDRLVAAMAVSNSAEIRASLEALRDLSYGQTDNDDAWREVLDLTERRRDLVESERRRKIELSLYLTREQADMKAQLLLDIIRRNVTDRSIIVAIVSEFRNAMEAARTIDRPTTIDV